MTYISAYATSKAYLLMLTEAVAHENLGHGLRLLAVSPGDTDTAMNNAPEGERRQTEQVVDTTFRARWRVAGCVMNARV